MITSQFFCSPILEQTPRSWPADSKFGTSTFQSPYTTAAWRKSRGCDRSRETTRRAMPSDRRTLDPEPEVVLFRTARYSKEGVPVSQPNGRGHRISNQLHALTIPTTRMGLRTRQDGHATLKGQRPLSLLLQQTINDS